MKSVSYLFSKSVEIIDGVFVFDEKSVHENQSHTNEVFSKKWGEYSTEEVSEQEKLFAFQRKWYLNLYGFKNEQDLANFLQKHPIILDAGCGLGYKAKWFSDLAPDSTIIGMDFSESIYIAADRYMDVENLYFIKGDIAKTNFDDSSIDYISCDQVIHHTQDVGKTFKELSRILTNCGELAVYVYAKKALPRELLDDYFRRAAKDISHNDMLELSTQLTDLGKTLSDLNIEISVPDIPLLNIKGGKINLQRFIYWNFIKCFWNDELGRIGSISTNYDWYSPTNAFRYSKEEFLEFAKKCNLKQVFLHEEEACYSGRFKKSFFK